jgi:REP-associated tyrosine transposase
MQRKRKGKPRRLELIFQAYDCPVFLVSFNALGRRQILARKEVQSALETYCRRAADFDVGVGRYVVMPDHVHLFVCMGRDSKVTLGEWVKGLKRHLDTALLMCGLEPLAFPGQTLRSFWQPGFHDYLLRESETYAQKWDYVRENSVRAGLVARADDWPFQGEIVRIDRV